MMKSFDIAFGNIDPLEDDIEKPAALFFTVLADIYKIPKENLQKWTYYTLNLIIYKMKLAQLDTKISDNVAMIAFYESLHLAAISIGDGPMPIGHTHFIESLLEQGKTTFKKDANKKILKKVAYLIAGKYAKASDLVPDIVHELKATKTSFDALVYTRRKMQTVISDAKVKAIIKKAVKTSPTVIKARAQVVKESKKHGLYEHEAVQDYID